MKVKLEAHGREFELEARDLVDAESGHFPVTLWVDGEVQHLSFYTAKPKDVE